MEKHFFYELHNDVFVSIIEAFYIPIFFKVCMRKILCNCNEVCTPLIKILN